MELELGLALPNTSWMKGFYLTGDIGNFGKKRRSKKAFVCKDGDDGNDGSGTNFESPHRLNKNMRVKVKMEGVAIGRKVDLSLLNSYQALNCALRQMFPSHLYEDEEGDWMLVGDVPWE